MGLCIRHGGNDNRISIGPTDCPQCLAEERTRRLLESEEQSRRQAARIHKENLAAAERRAEEEADRQREAQQHERDLIQWQADAEAERLAAIEAHQSQMYEDNLEYERERARIHNDAQIDLAVRKRTEVPARISEELRNKAYALIAAGMRDDARRMLDDAVKEDPTGPANHEMLGCLLMDMGRMNEGVESLCRGLRIACSSGKGRLEMIERCLAVARIKLNGTIRDNLLAACADAVSDSDFPLSVEVHLARGDHKRGVEAWKSQIARRVDEAGASHEKIFAALDGLRNDLFDSRWASISARVLNEIQKRELAYLTICEAELSVWKTYRVWLLLAVFFVVAGPLLAIAAGLIGPWPNLPIKGEIKGLVQAWKSAWIFIPVAIGYLMVLVAGPHSSTKKESFWSTLMYLIFGVAAIPLFSWVVWLAGRIVHFIVSIVKTYSLTSWDRVTFYYSLVLFAGIAWLVAVVMSLDFLEPRPWMPSAQRVRELKALKIPA